MGAITAAKHPQHHEPMSAPAQPAVALRRFETHQDLLDDMAAFRQRVSATPEGVRAFLIRAGLVTKTGKPKRLIRG